MPTSSTATIGDLLPPLAALGPVDAGAVDLHGAVLDVVWYLPGLEDDVRLDGALVLGSGLAPRAHATERVVAGLRHRGAAAVVLPGPPSDIEGVLWIGEHQLDWGRLLSIVRTRLREVTQPQGAGTQARQELNEIADAIADRLGGHVLLADRLRRIIGWASHGEVGAVRSRAIVEGRTPADMAKQMHADGTWHRLLSGEVVAYRGGPDDPTVRYGIAVRVGGEVVGLISVLPYVGTDHEALQAALPTVAEQAVPAFMRMLARGAEHGYLDEDTAALLEGRPGAARSAERLGLHRVDALVVAAFATPEHHRISPGRLLAQVDLHASGAHDRSRSVLLEDRVYLVGTARGDRWLRQVCEAVVAELRRGLVSVRCGLGSPAGNVTEVPRSRQEADAALQALLARPSLDAVATLEEVRGPAVALELARLTLHASWLANGPLAKLREAGEVELLQTVAGWLTNGLSGRATARALGLHPSTLHGRLARVRELTGIDLDDHETRLALEVELALMRSRGHM